MIIAKVKGLSEPEFTHHADTALVSLLFVFFPMFLGHSGSKINYLF